MFSAPSLTELIDDDGVSEEMDHAHHTPTQNGGRIMYLKLKKARLESQVAFTRTQLQLAEMQLKIMELDLQNEVQKSATPTLEPKTPARPPTKRRHKFAKLLSKAFKHSDSSQNTEEPDTTDPAPEIKDLVKKRKIVEATGMSKKLKSGSDKEYKENRNTSRRNNQEDGQEEADNSKKDKKEKKKSSGKKKKTVESGTKEKTEIATEKKHSHSDKKDKVTKDPQDKHSSRQHKHEKDKGKDDKNSKVDKGLTSIVKTSCGTEAINKNVIENISPENIGEDESTVELDIRTMFNTPLHSNNSVSKVVTTVDKGTSMDSKGVQSDAFAKIRENILVKETFFKKAEGDVVKVVDAMLHSLQNDQLFKELRNIQVKTEIGSSLGSLETLVLEEDSEDRKMELFM